MECAFLDVRGSVVGKLVVDNTNTYTNFPAALPLISRNARIPIILMIQSARKLIHYSTFSNPSEMGSPIEQPIGRSRRIQERKQLTTAPNFN
jgi:hypothetical protein